MREAARSDAATDLAIGLLLVVGLACWAGLSAAQLGRFGLVPVLAGAGLGLALAVAGVWRGRPTGDGGWTRAVDGPLVLVLAALLYLPGYDATLYASDATVYFATGAHLAQSGALAVDDPVLDRLPAALRAAAFPFVAPFGRPERPRLRSLGGLVFAGERSPVYSTFSQLPSVWMAIGFASAGLAGARAAGPLLGAAAIMALYLLARRLLGAPVALAAAALLGTAASQITFARMPTGEVGAQCFLWGALLAYARHLETRAPIAALAAGLGFGLVGLARPEYLAFLPLAALVLALLPGPARRLPALSVAVALVLAAHAVLLLLVVPSHYSDAAWSALAAMGLVLAPPAGPLAVAGVAAGALAAAVGLAALEGRGGGESRRRALGGAIVALWSVGYLMLVRSPSAGQGIGWLPLYLPWPVLVLALLGLPLLVWAWWREPAGRLALLVGGVAAFHLLYDPHTGPFPLWAARRLLPAVLPVLLLAAAVACGALARRSRPLGVALGATAVALTVWSSRPLLAGRPYFEGTAAAAEQVAELAPADALVVLDGSLATSLLDVPLLVIYGRSTIQGRGPATMVDRNLALLALALPDVPLYLVRPATLPAPSAPGLHFEGAGSARARLLLPGSGTRAAPEVANYTLIELRAWRVRLATG